MLNDANTDALLQLQRTYYEERAPDYMNPARPSDRRSRGDIPQPVAAALVDEFAPTGDVLELACGAGFWTKEIAHHADALTALDGSPRMIARNRRATADPKVTYVLADIFAWEPDRKYDAVVFSFWLSHVPPNERFDDFWRRVGHCLKRGGRVCFVDEDERGAVLEDAVSEVAGVPVARRTLADGRAFDIVKVFWSASELERRLNGLGWSIAVRPIGDMFLLGSGTRVGG